LSMHVWKTPERCATEASWAKASKMPRRGTAFNSGCKASAGNWNSIADRSVSAVFGNNLHIAACDACISASLESTSAILYRTSADSQGNSISLPYMKSSARSTCEWHCCGNNLARSVLRASKPSLTAPVKNPQARLPLAKTSLCNL